MLGLQSDIELPTELVEQLGDLGLVPGTDDYVEPLTISSDSAESLIDELRQRVGGEANLAVLDDTPLPAEGFNTDGINSNVLPRVRDLAAELSLFAGAHFRDQEMTTVALRVLSLVARTNPDVFRRGFTHPPAIAALCWIAGKYNRRFMTGVRRRTIQTMFLAAGGSTPPAAQAKSMLSNVNYTLQDQELVLGDPGLLTSWAREDILIMRDVVIG